MITKRQKLVLDFIKNHQKKRGYSPSLEEIQVHFKYASVSTAHFHVDQLKKKGFLIKEEKHPRAISAIKENSTVEVSIVGIISAGHPIEAIENPTQSISISREDIKVPLAYYALRVRGDSMIEDGIFDGDVVVVKSQKTANDGQTVVAIIDEGKATLKRIYKEKNTIRLQPANQNYKPFRRKKVEIRGVVEKVIRNLP